MIIWGYRRIIQQLVMLTLLCGNCGNPAAHALKRAVTKFTLFFIPLFPIRSRYFTQCTFCGTTRPVSKDDAARLREQGNQPYPAQQQPHPAQQGQPQQQYPPQGGQQYGGQQQWQPPQQGQPQQQYPQPYQNRY